MPEFDFDSLNEVKEVKKELKASDIKEAIKKNAEKKEDVFDTSSVIIPTPEIKKVEKPQPKITKPTPKTEEFPIEIIEKSQTIIEKKQYILESLNLLEFTIKNILKPSDYYNGNITKSGALKLAATFNISFEVISIDVENEYDKDGKLIDVHAHAKAKATKTNGSFNIATGDKSKSEYWSEKSQKYGRYNLHYLRQTAATRATNRAILNAVGFGMVSAEEIEQEKDAFGGE